MSLSRGQKKSGSLTRKIKEKLDRHRELMDDYVRQGVTPEEASKLAFQAIKHGRLHGAIVPLPEAKANER